MVVINNSIQGVNDELEREPVTFREGEHWEKLKLVGKGSYGKVWIARKLCGYFIEQWGAIETDFFYVKTVRMFYQCTSQLNFEAGNPTTLFSSFGIFQQKKNTVKLLNSKN